MTVKCSVYIAASVDGFIARADGDIAWLDSPRYLDVKMNGLSYDDFIATVDALVMGRNSFEKVLTFGFWPYQVPVIVMTSRKLVIPEELKNKVRRENCSPPELTELLAKEGKKHLYIDGGITIQRFLEAGLINEITITRIPVLLGSGIPLFTDTGNETELELIEAISSENGFVQERYRVKSGS